MINSTKEWHWMDDRSGREEKLKGWALGSFMCVGAN